MNNTVQQLLSILVSLSFYVAGTPALAQETLSGQILVDALKRGGYSIYFRHEETDWSRQDRVDKVDDWMSCDQRRMRQLSPLGRERARKTGHAIRKLGIPVDQVLASPYCRTMETAQLMALGPVKATHDVMNLRAAHYVGGRASVLKRAQALLAQPPQAGFNRVIVAHGNVAREATPVYPDEGEGIVFLADGKGRFSFIGRLPPSQWDSLLGP